RMLPELTRRSATRGRGSRADRRGGAVGRPSPRPEERRVPDDHDPTRGPSLYALSRVHRTARTAADRVREALTPPGAVIAPLRVLVVDDHPDAADALVAVLELLGCPARACYSGHSALAAAEEFDPQVC